MELPAFRDLAVRAACVAGNCFLLELAAAAGSRRRCVRRRYAGGRRARGVGDLGRWLNKGSCHKQRCNRGNGPDDGKQCLGCVLKRASICWQRSSPFGAWASIGVFGQVPTS
jgi:hypothetical protein